MPLGAVEGTKAPTTSTASTAARRLSRSRLSSAWPTYSIGATQVSGTTRTTIPPIIALAMYSS